MKNQNLSKDYVIRSQKRLLALETLFSQESWADVVREAQEIVELTLKGLLRHANIEIPRVHDVGDILLENRSLITKFLPEKEIEKLAEISHDLRRDRELAFYGSEDLTPSEFYRKKDATKAQTEAKWVVTTVAKVILP